MFESRVFVMIAIAGMCSLPGACLGGRTAWCNHPVRVSSETVLCPLGAFLGFWCVILRGDAAGFGRSPGRLFGVGVDAAARRDRFTHGASLSARLLHRLAGVWRVDGRTTVSSS